MTTDTIKDMGPHFHRAADSLADTLARLDNARHDRLAFLRRCSKDSTARLAALKEVVRTLPEQIAKWDAEAARLESQTAEDLLRQALETKGGDANATRDNGGARDGESTSSYARSGISPDGLQVEAPSVGKAEGEPFRAGLPLERLRKVWAEWEDESGIVQLRKNGDGWEYRYAHWPNEQEWGDVYSDIWGSANIRPHGATWARVEVMADEAEKVAAPKMLDLRDLARGTRIEMLGNATGGLGGLIKRGMIVTLEGVPAAQPIVSWIADGRPYERAVCHMQPARVVKEGGEQ